MTLSDSPTIFIVKYTHGDWDGFVRVNVFATYDEEIAKAYCEKFNRILKKWKSYWAQYVNSDNWLEPSNIHFERWLYIDKTNEAYYDKLEIRK
jgi:hypothetical protein